MWVGASWWKSLALVSARTLVFVDCGIVNDQLNNQVGCVTVNTSLIFEHGEYREQQKSVTPGSFSKRFA